MQCIRVREGADAVWEEGYNRALTVPPQGTALLIEWSGEAVVEGSPEAVALAARQAAPRQAAQQDWQQQPAAQQHREAAPLLAALASTDRGSGSESDSDSGGFSGSVTSSLDDSQALLPQWQGKELRFMRSNEHSRCAGGSGRARGCCRRSSGRSAACVLPPPLTPPPAHPARLPAASARACGTLTACRGRR